MKMEINWTVRKAEITKGGEQEILVADGPGFCVFLRDIGSGMHEAKGLVFDGLQSDGPSFKEINVESKPFFVLEKEVPELVRNMLRPHEQHGNQLPRITLEEVLHSTS